MKMNITNVYLLICLVLIVNSVKGASVKHEIFSDKSERIEQKKFKVTSPFWSNKMKDIIVNYVPMCVDILEKDTSNWHALDFFYQAANKISGLPFHVPKDNTIWSDNPVLNTFEAMCWSLTIDPQGDKEIETAQVNFKEKINKWVPMFINAMEPDGYFSTKSTMFDYAHFENPNPFVNLHLDYTLGYYLECAMALYHATDGKDMRLYYACKKTVNLWCNSVGHYPKKEYQTFHPGLKQSLVKFADLVESLDGFGAARSYYNLALYLMDNRGVKPYPKDERIDDNGRRYFGRDVPNMTMTELRGHAVMNMYLLSGMGEVYRSLDKIYLGNDSMLYKRFLDYDNQTTILWNNLVNKKMYINGTIGSARNGEALEADYVLPNNSYSETCASVGLMLIQNVMGLIHGDAKCADVTENALYNGVLSSLDLDCKNWSYCNPLVIDKDPVDLYSNEKRKSNGEDCCMSNSSRTLLQLPMYMYSKNQSSIRINQFVGSEFTIGNVGGTDVKIVQQTNYPLDGKISITIEPNQSKQFKVYIRIPNHQFSDLYQPTPLVSGYKSFKLNGKSIDPEMYKGYAVLNRKWKKGDRIELSLPMKVQKIHAIANVKEDSSRVAFSYGPFIYAIEAVDLRGKAPESVKVAKNTPLKMNFEKNLLGGIWTITGKLSNNSSFKAIPFYLRMNRDKTGKYSLWMKEE